jgi:hypothetical protein
MDQPIWIRGETLFFRDEMDSLFLFGEQRLDFLPHDLLTFDTVEVQLPVPAIADVALLVDEISTWPEAVIPGRPILAGIVHDDRILHVVVFDLATDLIDLMLVGRLRRVNADDR